MQTSNGRQMYVCYQGQVTLDISHEVMRVLIHWMSDVRAWMQKCSQFSCGNGSEKEMRITAAVIFL